MVKRFKQVIAEGRDAPLYHGTTFASAKEILRTGLLNGGEFSADKYRLPATSMTRSPQFAVNWMKHNDVQGLELYIDDEGFQSIRTIIRTTDVVLVFDQSKLIHNHRIVPYNYWSYHPSKLHTRPAQVRDTYGNDAAEEYIPGVVRNVWKYIKQVIVLHPYSREQVLELLLLCRPHGIRVGFSDVR